MKHTKPKPAGVVLAFFRWYCNPGFREEIEGDLMERFYQFAEKHGAKKARWHFTKEVFLLLRPSIIGNMHHLINKNSSFMTLQNKRLLSILATAAILLFIPLVAMQFTSEVSWGFFDFLVAAILLVGTGLGLEFILRKVKGVRYRIILSVALFIVLFLIWAELAVGIFGSPLAGS